MPQNQRTKQEKQNRKPSYQLSKSVQCVPGGHQISISEAYWCNECGWYICYSHLKTGTLLDWKKCPKGHEVTKAA